MAKGRPPKFETPEQMQVLIDEYFKKCEGELLRDNEGRPVLDKWGNPVIIGAEPPTITGLALALGFNSRQSLLNYEARDEGFLDTITRAKARVEKYVEVRLFDKDGVNGAKFSLANNFRGWKEQRAMEHTGPNGGPIEANVKVSRVAHLTPEERDALLAELDITEGSEDDLERFKAEVTE